MVKVLFLDIDGVVNCRTTVQRFQGLRGIDPSLALLVRRITLAVTDLRVVLSSSWRNFPAGRREVEIQVVPIFDTTPPRKGKRGDEIQAWLDGHPEVEKYAIIDDSSDWREDQRHQLFLTTDEIGITETIVQRIINHFNS
jgi:hypothetical protein